MKDKSKIINWLTSGSIVGMPTETVYGIHALISKVAVTKINHIKKRPANKGLIIVSNCIDYLMPYIDTSRLTPVNLQNLNGIYNPAVTWLVPAKEGLDWLSGSNKDFIAVRITSHPVLRSIIEELKQPLISTSASIGVDVAEDHKQAKKLFRDEVNYVEGASLESRASRIENLITKEIIRS